MILMKPLKFMAQAAISACIGLGFALPALGQTFPDKPVRLISPYAPGGGNDIVSRIVAEQLSKLWGQSVIVENRPGAGGNIGTNIVAKAAPDGYTLVMGSLSYAINASLYSSLPFDPVKDLTPVTLLASGSYMLVAHPSLPAHSVKELIELAKRTPERISYASAGNGSGGHLGMEMFRKAAGIELVHVPYKGQAPATSDVLGGQVPLTFDNVITAMPNVKADRLRALAVTGLQRSPLAPDVPTMVESGFPGFEVNPWFGLLAPAGTPPEVVRKISADCAQVLALPQVKALLRAQGAEAVGSTEEQFAEYMASEIEKWRQVVKETGARID